ncbi:helix-turn-helix domain-containing protein [Arthrobacter sp. TWP1-1]|uniref:helix-turn-helix domain-containing protein n=1 Tax=Arthrobacter sp. TWP1-1 TaxID=2804568 RepID=UPI003CF228BD
MTQVQTWSTDPIPEPERFAAWSEKMRALHMDWDLSTPVERGYSAKIRYRGMGNLKIAEVSCSAFQGRHVPSAAGAGLVGIQLHLSGQMACTYGSEQFTINPGDLFVWGGDRSGTFKSYGQHQQLSLLMPVTRVPKSILSTLERSRPLVTSPGSGELSLVAGQLRGIAGELDQLSDDAMNRAVNGLLDLLDSALAPDQDASSGQRATLLAEIQKYITEHLEDRALSVGSIAAAHWISVRTLHMMFAESDTSVARSILQQRLERCRRDLAGASETTTVTSVAFRWGFSDTAHFSRTFKKEFGVPPTTVMPQFRTRSAPSSD